MSTAKTFNGGTSAYASPSDYLNRIDVRLTGDLSVDSGGEADPTSLLTNPRLLQALSDASGDVELALLKGERYSIADLQALPTGSNALGTLQRIVCGLAVQYMREARGYMGESNYPMYLRAKEALLQLMNGAAILPFVEVEEAGIPETEQLTIADLMQDTPNLVTLQSRYWPCRDIRSGNRGGTGFF